jgi:hypothetical protein
MELVTDQENLQHQETLNDQVDLQPFAKQLQERLLSLSQEIPFQVKCVLRRGDLMVLSQHPPGSMPDPGQVFRILEQTVQTSLPDFTWELFGVGTVPIGAEATLYLRILGQKHPYAFHRFKLATGNLTESEEALPDLLAEPLSDCSGQVEEAVDRDNEPAHESFETESGLVLRTLEPDWDTLKPDWDTFSVEDAPPEEAQTPLVAEGTGRSQWIPWILTGVGVSIISFAGGMFLMSRPCMVKMCESLEKAQILNQQATQTLQKAKSGQDLKQAQQQLNEGSQLLKGIPSWSRRHEEAQALFQSDQSQLALLDRVLAAEQKAETAMQRTRTLPQSVADWRGVQALWQEAIAQLGTIPPETPLHSFVQERLATYRENLRTIDQYIVAEQQAQKKLAVAKSTANTASARQGLAQSPENWQRVQATWQVAVNYLRQIPNTTTNFAEAQQLIGEYESKLGIARDRVTRENLAKNGLTQGVALARKAVMLQQQNQWNQAVATWRSAVNQLNQVPEDTVYHDRAQPLIAAYASSLEQAETQLNLAVAQQKIRTDLDQVCSGAPKTCIYVITPNLIRVQFTPTYEKALQQAYAVGQAGNYNVLGGAVNHVDSLQTALQTICNNAGIPLEVYGSNGAELLGSFNPGG